jgi:signal transduction histidine kinase
MTTTSAQATDGRPQIARGPVAGTSRGQKARRARRLVLVAVAAAAFYEASVVVAADADPLGETLTAAFGFPGRSFLPAVVLLAALASAIVCRGLVGTTQEASSNEHALDSGFPDGTSLTLENDRLRAELRASTQELRRSRARIAAAAAAERRRLERELHDRAQNRLVGLQIRLALVQEKVEQSTPEVAAMLAALGDQTAAVMDELRRIAQGIYPPVLATYGLVQALTSDVQGSGVALRVLAEQVPLSAPEVELAAYLCCLEAIQNAAKHAGRDVRVTVRLRCDAGELMFSVEDGGCGFDATEAANGTGLIGMRDRIAAVGGSVAVTSAPGHGTIVSGAVPWPARDG